MTEFTPGPFPADGPIAVGALVVVQDDDDIATTHLLVPVAGGEKLDVDGRVVQSLSPRSPLGRELIGRRADEEFELDLPRGRITCTVISVR